jgi:AraC-like DNA-binding protein
MVGRTMKAPQRAYSEASAWKKIDGQWRQLYGNFRQDGVSIEWHEFSNEEELDWSKSFHRDCLEICLNFSGQGTLQQGKSALLLAPQQVALYTIGEDKPKATRPSGHLHRFATLELSAGYLHRQFGTLLDKLSPPVRQFVEQPESILPYVEVKTMSSRLEALRPHLLEPPVNAAAQAVWYQSKVLEILAQLIFADEAPGEMFCDRQKRLNRDRAERTRYLLARDLENPPSLEMLSQVINCSPFHLSRIFMQETGQTIPQYLRTVRMEKAAELLKSGECNVTEAAMAVGYASLSAFNRAFVEQIGCCPGLYPVMANKK